MRYPVNDDFAIAIGAGLYRSLLDYENELPRALQSALGDVVSAWADETGTDVVLLGSRERVSR